MIPEIVPASTTRHLEMARELFQAYAEDLGVDLSYQDFDHELLSLPADYEAPAGALLLAMTADEAVGCCALRPLADDACEMKRLFVSPQWRGQGLGRVLACRIIRAARDAGYRAIRLDTLENLAAAAGLYHSLGFVEIEPYTHNPLSGAKFLELRW